MSTDESEDRRLQDEIGAEHAGIAHCMQVIVKATADGGVSASELAERLGVSISELHPFGLQALANITFEAGTEFREACAELGQEENIVQAIRVLKQTRDARDPTSAIATMLTPDQWVTLLDGAPLVARAWDDGRRFYVGGKEAACVWLSQGGSVAYALTNRGTTDAGTSQHATLAAAKAAADARLTMAGVRLAGDAVHGSP